MIEQENDKSKTENAQLSQLDKIIAKLESGKWHHLAVTMGDTTFYWIDGNFAGYDEQANS